MPTTREFEGTTIHCWESGTGHALPRSDATAVTRRVTIGTGCPAYRQ